MQTAAKTSTDPTEAIVHLRRGLIAQGYRVRSLQWEEGLWPGLVKLKVVSGADGGPGAVVPARS